MFNPNPLLLNHNGQIARGPVSVPVDWSNLLLSHEMNGDTADTNGWWGDATGNYPITYNNSGSPSPTKVTGVKGDARQHLTGYQLWSTNGLGLDSDAGDFTLMAWMKPSSSKNGGRDIIISSLGWDNTSQHVCFQTYTNGSGIQLWLKSGSDGFMSATTNKADQWQLVAVVREYATNKWSFYVDGVGKGSSTSFATNVINTSYKLGYWGTYSSYGGSCAIDLIRIFTRALDVDELLQHYNAGAGLSYLEGA